MSAGVSDQSLEPGMQNIGLEVNPPSQSVQRKDMPISANSSSEPNLSKKSDQPKETIPKKMTWASVASQPAKPPVRTNSTTSTLKKKGPGMPPPPMVPGKHNMDIGTWDTSSKNPPPLLPPPIPPPIITTATVSTESLGPASQTQSKTQHPTASLSSSNPQYSPQSHSKLNRQPMEQSHQSSSPMNNANNRSNWAQTNDNRRGGNNHQNHMMAHNQHQMPPYHHHQQQNPQHHHQGQHHPHPIHHGQAPYQQQITSNHHQYNQRNHQIHGPQLPLQQPQSGGQPPMINNQSGVGPGNENYDTLVTQMNSLQLQQQQYQQNQRGLQSPVSNCSSTGSHPVLEKLRDKNNYNPEELDMEKANIARFFVIKSYSEDDIHRSIKYEIWCSTEHGNKRLDQAYREVEKDNGIIYLFFSVNGSGHFCGIAQMISPVDYNSNSSVWSQNKWKGVFKVRWIYVKDIPNTHLRHIHLENNENKSVTHSRDAQEVPNAKGQQVLKLIHSYKHTTSIFDDFTHYEKRQEEEDSRKDSPGALSGSEGPVGPPKLGTLGPSGSLGGPPIKHNNYDNSSCSNPSRSNYSTYDKPNHYNNNNDGGGGSSGGANSYEKYGSYNGKNYGYENRKQYNNHRSSGNYNYNYDNRRDDRGTREVSGYDRKDSHDGGSNSGYYNRDSDFQHNKGHRNSMGGGNLERIDYRDQRRDDPRSFNNRDRDQDSGIGIGGIGYGNRGGHRDNYRDRGGRFGGGGISRGGNNNGVYRN